MRSGTEYLLDQRRATAFLASFEPLVIPTMVVKRSSANQMSIAFIYTRVGVKRCTVCPAFAKL